MKNYDLLKTAVLRKHEIDRDTYHQCFCSHETPVENTTQELYTRLKDCFFPVSRCEGLGERAQPKDVHVTAHRTRQESTIMQDN